MQIDSVKTTAGTCSNNGSITVFATGVNSPFLYSIIAGPLTQPAQTNPVFNSLPQGNYTVQVTDAIGNNKTQNTTVTVSAYKQDSIVKNICHGDIYTIGTHIYRTPGIYRDTLPTSTCDSIVILNLIPGSCPPLPDPPGPPVPCKFVSGIAINTGYDPIGDTALPPGQPDTNWVVTAVSPAMQGIAGEVTPGSASWIIPTIPVALFYYPKSNFISSVNNGSNAFPTVLNGVYTTTVTRTFRTVVVDSFIIVMNITADNYVSELLIDKKPMPLASYIVSLQYSDNRAYRLLLPPGTHTITITFNNYTGQAYPSNFFGLIVWGAVSSKTGINSIVSASSSLNCAVCSGIITRTIDTSICTSQSYLGHTTSGTYTESQITAEGCDSTTILHLTVGDYKSRVITQSLCQGQSHTFNGHTYTTSGQYSDTFHTTTCDSIATLQLTIHPIPAVNITASATSVKTGDIVQLNANTNEQLTYLWTSAARLDVNTNGNPKATMNNSSWIYLLATDKNGCSNTDSVFITVELPCSIGPSRIYIPTAFTPNGDGINEVFRIKGYDITLNKLEVYNRLGERVFVTSDIQEGWNGRFKGAVLPGSYVYMVHYTECDGVTHKVLQGNVVLLR